MTLQAAIDHARARIPDSNLEGQVKHVQAIVDGYSDIDIVKALNERVRISRAHDLVDQLMEFANSHRSGYCKQWKAAGILVQVAQTPSDYQGEGLVEFVKNCLVMEGFYEEDCENIAAWIERNLLTETVE